MRLCSGPGGRKGPLVYSSPATNVTAEEMLPARLPISAPRWQEAARRAAVISRAAAPPVARRCSGDEQRRGPCAGCAPESPL